MSLIHAASTLPTRIRTGYLPGSQPKTWLLQCLQAVIVMAPGGSRHARKNQSRRGDSPDGFVCAQNGQTLRLPRVCVPSFPMARRAPFQVLGVVAQSVIYGDAGPRAPDLHFAFQILGGYCSHSHNMRPFGTARQLCEAACSCLTKAVLLVGR
jgi:hypothetical protein